MTKQPKPSPALAQCSSRVAPLAVTSRASVVDVLERVTKGVIVEPEERSGASTTSGDASLRGVSRAGAYVLEVESSVSWRYLFEDKEREEGS